MKKEKMALAKWQNGKMAKLINSGKSDMLEVTHKVDA